jgi:hypothetical protein
MELLTATNSLFDAGVCMHLIEICNEGEGEPTDVPRQRPRMESAMSRGRASASIWAGRDKTMARWASLMARRASLMEESARSSCGIASRTALQTRYS